MRTLPTGMQEHLDSRVTTLCWGWKLTRTDGKVLCFTDHDAPLLLGGFTYMAHTGFTPSTIPANLSLAVGTTEVQGALDSEALTEEDLANGLWDNADVELWRINWTDTTQSILIRAGSIGEVRRGNLVFIAELRGLSHFLNQPMGRTYGYSCDAVLGDSRCKIDLTNAAYKSTGAIVSVLEDNRWFTVSGAVASGFANRWFSKGKLTWVTGANAGVKCEIRNSSIVTTVTQIELAEPTASAVVAGDTFSVVAGCDKQFGTCRYKFSNAVNFRGFPWMPSNDRITAYPNQGVANDGKSLFGN